VFAHVGLGNISYNVQLHSKMQLVPLPLWSVIKT